MSELVEAIGLAMKEYGSKDERRAALDRAMELAKASEAPDATRYICELLDDLWKMDGYVALSAIPAAWAVDVDVELGRAKMHGETFASLHEAYAVILEELDEIWDVVRQKKCERNADDLRKEFVQLAAMAFKAMASMGSFTGGKV